MYFDNHATTPVDPQVLDAMLPYFKEQYGNPASGNHKKGWDALSALEAARKQVGQIIGANAQEITFTSGATESNNIALLGFARANKDSGNHVIVSQIEHKSVKDTALKLKSEGFDVSFVECNSSGIVSVESIEKVITPKTILISLQAVNNEIGTIQPLEEVAKLAEKKNITLHTDLSQALTTLSIDKNKIPFDLATWTAHKMYGPKGIGALFVRQKSPRIKIEPLLFGGGHERGLRSGTLNMPAIIGFAKATQLAIENRNKDYEHLKNLRDFIWKNLSQKLNGLKLSGDLNQRLANNLNFVLPENVNMEAFLKKISPLCISTGSACTTAQIAISHVLKAIGRTDQEAQRSVRIGLGRQNTFEEAQKAVDLIVDACSLRA
ncbi:MAG: cysteine desulfurase [Oligoflexia bacterium]|nr:cysteine desulfurase [Oligoflexia bacterium]